MRNHGSEPSDGTYVALGYGLKIYVERGHLIVHDGVGRNRRTKRFSRAMSSLNRLVVVGHTGFVTLEALRWIQDVGAGFVQLDGDGKVVTVSAAQAADYAALRRSQAVALSNGVGLAVSRDILAQKVSGQRDLLDELSGPPEAHSAVTQSLREIELAQDISTLLTAEAAAANAYWHAWAPVPVLFSRSDAKRVPSHWLSFGMRRSPLTQSARLAVNPANAILNYLYAMLEAETIMACQVVGLDPGIGLFHADRKARASLALDVMEACRPVVDAYVLALLTERRLRANQFVETRRGNCRLRPTMALDLTKTATTWQEHVAPIVEKVAQTFSDQSARPVKLPTPLTRSTLIESWDTRRTATKRQSVSVPRLPSTCRYCGAELPKGSYRRCTNCRRDQLEGVSERGRSVAQEVLQRLRDGGFDPAHGGEAARSRGEKNAGHQRQIVEWNKRNGRSDPRLFCNEVLPALQAVPISVLVAATGLSETYCSRIRLGKTVPHPRHWEALRTAAQSQATTT